MPDSGKVELLQSLQKMRLFGGLLPAQLTRVQQAGRERKYEEGAYLYYQGDPAEIVFTVIQGRIRLTQITPEGQQVILRYAAPGEVFGVVAVLAQTNYPVSAQSVEESRVFIWRNADMRALMVVIPEIAINALEIMSQRVREFQDRIRELSTEKVERRIARALLRLARQTGRKTNEGVLIDMPISRQDLAQMTGTTLFTVSRTLSQWESKGLIRSGREEVLILFPHGLVTIAEDLPTGKVPHELE